MTNLFSIRKSRWFLRMIILLIIACSYFSLLAQDNTQTISKTEYYAPLNITSTATIIGPIIAHPGDSYNIKVIGSTSAGMCNWIAYENSVRIGGSSLVFGSSVDKTFTPVNPVLGINTYEFWYRGIVGAHNWPDYTKVDIKVQVAPAIQPPNAPMNLFTSPASSSQIILTWQDTSNNEDGFKVERATKCHEPFVEIAAVGPSEVTGTYSDTNLLPGAVYYYRVKAFNQAGESNYSNRAESVTLAHITTIDEIITALEQYNNTGLINDYNAYVLLNGKLHQAQYYINLKDYPSAISQLNDFSAELNSLTEESIDPVAKESLLKLAKALTGYLKLIFELPATMGLYLTTQTCVNEVTINLSDGSEATIVLKGILNIALSPTGNPDVASVTIIKSQYTSMPLIVNGTDFGALSIYQDPSNPSVGTLDLKTGKIDIVENVLITSPYLSPVALAIPQTGTFYPMSLFDGIACLIGRGIFPPDIKNLGLLDFFINCLCPEDSTPPEVVPDSETIEPGVKIDNVYIVSETTITVTKTVTDDGSGVDTVKVTIKDKDGKIVAEGVDLSLSDGTNSNGTWTGPVTLPDDLPDGEYTAEQEITDLAGNVTTSSIPFKLDRTPPDIIGDIFEPPIILIDHELYGTSSTVIAVGKIIDDGNGSGVGSVKIRIYDKDGNLVREVDVPETGLPGFWRTEIKNLPEGEYTFVQVVTDKAGNVTTVTKKIIIDWTDPVIRTEEITVSGTDVAITKTITDNLAGVKTVDVDIVDPRTGKVIAKGKLSLTDGTTLSGTWTGSIALPEGTLPGQYICSQGCTDRVGNQPPKTWKPFTKLPPPPPDGNQPPKCKCDIYDFGVYGGPVINPTLRHTSNSYTHCGLKIGMEMLGDDGKELKDVDDWYLGCTGGWWEGAIFHRCLQFLPPFSITDEIKVTWKLDGAGKIESSGKASIYYMPSELKIDEKISALLTITIADGRGHPGDNCRLTYSIEVTRRGIRDYTVVIDPKPVEPRSNPAFQMEEIVCAECRCCIDVQTYKWEIGDLLKITGEIPQDKYIPVSVPVILEAPTATDNDTLDVKCPGGGVKNCPPHNKSFPQQDTVYYEWLFKPLDAGLLAVIPPFLNDSGKEAIFVATTPGKIDFTVTADDRGLQANDTAIKTDISKTAVQVDLDIEGITDETKEETEGGFLMLNDDNDPVNKEDDLVEIKLSIKPDNIKEGTTTLEIKQDGDAKIKIWEEKTKKKEVTVLTWAVKDMPKKLYVEGIKTSDKVRDIGLRLIWTPPAASKYEFVDKVRLTVIKVDLDVSKLDADKDQWGQSTNWKPLNEDEEDGESKDRDKFGGMVGLNSDDDNHNYKPDYEDNTFNTSDDDLVPIDVKIDYPKETVVKLILTNGNDKVRIWRDKDKTLVLGKGASKQEITLRESGKDHVSEKFWVEGVKFSEAKNDITLRLETDKYWDEIKINVIGVETWTLPNTGKTTSFIVLISELGKPQDISVADYVSANPRVYAHVYTAGIDIPGPNGDVDLEIYSYNAGWQITNQGANGTQEIYNGPVGDDVELEPDLTRPKGNYWNALNDGGIWAVDNTSIDYYESRGDESVSIVSQGGGEIVIRLWEDLPDWVAIRPPGWMMNVVGINLFRDQGLLQPLTDWPSGGNKTLSPRFLLASNDQIHIQVSGLGNDSATVETIEVNVKSDSDSAGINLKETSANSRIFRNSDTTETLYLSTDSSKGTDSKIKVIDEETLTFTLNKTPQCYKKVMIDRAEFASCGIRRFYELISRATVRTEALANANFFDVGDGRYPDNVGGVIPNQMQQFIKNAGADTADNGEADILYSTSHGSKDGNLWDDTGDLIIDPDSTDGIINNTDWNNDIDWVMLDACSELNRKEGGALAWAQSLRGAPKRIHGVLGFNDRVSANITPQISDFWQRIRNGDEIVESYGLAMESGTKPEPWTVVFYEVNRKDLLKEMLRDANPKDNISVIYLDTDTEKSISIKGISKTEEIIDKNRGVVSCILPGNRSASLNIKTTPLVSIYETPLPLTKKKHLFSNGRMEMIGDYSLKTDSKISDKEAEQLASGFVAKYLPSIKEKVVLKSTSKRYSGSIDENGGFNAKVTGYVIHFEFTNDSIPIDGDYVNVLISGDEISGVALKCHSDNTAVNTPVISIMPSREALTKSLEEIKKQLSINEKYEIIDASLRYKETIDLEVKEKAGEGLFIPVWQFVVKPVENNKNFSAPSYKIWIDAKTGKFLGKSLQSRKNSRDWDYTYERIFKDTKSEYIAGTLSYQNYFISPEVNCIITPVGSFECVKEAPPWAKGQKPPQWIPSYIDEGGSKHMMRSDYNSSIKKFLDLPSMPLSTKAKEVSDPIPAELLTRGWYVGDFNARYKGTPSQWCYCPPYKVWLDPLKIEAFLLIGIKDNDSLDLAFEKAHATVIKNYRKSRAQGENLAKLYGKDAISFLETKANDDSNRSAQLIAFWALGFIGERKGVEILVANALRHKSHLDKYQIAIVAIAMADEQNARWGLEQIVQDSAFESAKHAACYFLRVLGDLKTLEVLDKIEQPTLANTIKITKSCILYRIKELKTEEERKAYAEFELTFWDERITSPSAHAITEEIEISDIAEQITVRMNKKVSFKFLSRKLDEATSEEDERAITCYLCGLLKETQAINILIQLAISGGETKIPSRYALAVIGGQKAADTIEEILTTQEYTPRMIRYMIECGTEKNAKSLEEKAGKESNPERAKAFKDAADGIRKRLKEEAERDSQSPKDK